MSKKKRGDADEKLKKSGGKYRSLIIIFAGDLLFAVFSYWLARTIMFYALPTPAGYLEHELAIAAVSVAVVLAMLLFFDSYNTLWKYAGRVEFFKFLMAYIVAFVVLFIFKHVMNFAFDVQVWVPLILDYLLFSAILSGAMRFFYGIIHYIRHIRNRIALKNPDGAKRAVVIGAGFTGSLVINRFINNPDEGYTPVAVLDDDPVKLNMKIYGVKVEGNIDSVERVVKATNAEVIVIAIQNISKVQLKNIYTRCRIVNLPIKVMPAMADAGNMLLSTLSLRDIKIEELLGRDEFKVRKELIDVAVKDKVVCVTGGAGSIGSELCRQALNFGCKHLVIFDMHENGMFDLNQEFSKKYDTSRYTLVMGTVREKQKLEETFEKYKPEVVFHAAAYKHVPMMEISATEAVKNNVFGTLNVIEQSIASNVEKFVLISTDKAVNPANVMGASKRIAEMCVQTKGKSSKMKMAAVRFGNVLGSNGSVIPIFMKQIKEGGPITLTDRNIKRYFMTIPEAVRLVLQTGAFADSGEIFVLDMGEPVYIYDLACDLIRINGLKPEKDIEIKVTGLRPGEKLFEELRYDKEMVDSTAHEGIFVTRMENVNEKTFFKKLETLKAAATEEDAAKTESLMFDIVPGETHKKAKEERIRQLAELKKAEEASKDDATEETAEQPLQEQSKADGLASAAVGVKRSEQ